MFRHAILLLALSAMPALAQQAVPQADCTVDADLAPALKLDIQVRCRTGTEDRYRADLTQGESSRSEEHTSELQSH